MTIPNNEFFDFVAGHAGDDTARLRLAMSGKALPFPLDLALVQIEARRRTASRLRPFVAHREFLFPTALIAEQATDFRVAALHADMAGADDAGIPRVLDLTAGLGIDALTMAMRGMRVCAVEIESDKCDALRHNALVCGTELTVANGDAAVYVRQLPPDSYDTIYIDPARRGGAGDRVHAFSDCAPDIISMMPDMLRAASRVMVKASPMMDITAAARAWPGLVSRIDIVSVRGEVKEVLLTLERPLPEGEARQCLTVCDMIGLPGADTGVMTFVCGKSTGHTAPIYCDGMELRAGMWLYEPDAAVMKAAPWSALCHAFPGLHKVSPDTHLFVSETPVEGFPGRRMEIGGVLSKRDLKPLRGERFNVCTRNYPMSADALRQRLGVRDGGDGFLYGMRGPDGRTLIVRAVRT